MSDEVNQRNFAVVQQFAEQTRQLVRQANDRADHAVAVASHARQQVDELRVTVAQLQARLYVMSQENNRGDLD